MSQASEQIARQYANGSVNKKTWGTLVFNVASYGAVPMDANPTFDSGPSIQEAIDDAASVGRMTIVDLGGARYLANSTIYIKNRVILRNGTIVNNSVPADRAIIQIGVSTGGSLIRPAGVENVIVETSSTAKGVAGFRMDTLVRNCWFKNCWAQMNEDSLATRGQIAFEIVSTQSVDATSGGVGAYQNLIENCTGYNAYGAFRIRTRNYTNDPQANANRITDCNAYSCSASALIIEAGAQDNVIRGLRADTFNLSTGKGIQVVDIYGNYNIVEVSEEVGTATVGEQYTVRLRSGARYNHVDYHTHQVKTATVLDENTATKNTTRFITQLDSNGGLTENFSYYTENAVGANITQNLRCVWTAPRKCVVLGVVVKLDANVQVASFFHAYAAKNGVYSVNNRIEFAPGEGTTFKEIQTDPSAAGTIASNWYLNKGDQIYLAFSNGGGGSIRASVTVILKHLE